MGRYDPKKSIQKLKRKLNTTLDLLVDYATDLQSANQVADMALLGPENRCEIVSEVTCDGEGGNRFETRCPVTGCKFEVIVKIKEIT